MKKYYFIFLLGILYSQILLAQNSKDFDENYLKAKQSLNSGNYLQAMELLKPLLKAHKNNTHQAEANYFYANAALKVKDYQAIFTVSNTFFKDFSTWYGLDDFRFIYEIALFSKGNYAQAISQHFLLKDENVIKQSSNYQTNVINFKIPFDTLVSLNNKFPNHFIIKPLVEKELKKRKPVIAKGKLRIALILPFDVADIKISHSQTRDNQYALDFYQGIKEGLKTLDSCAVELFAYDCSKDSNELKSLLKLPEMKSMDILLGPVFSSQAHIVSRFANQNNIVFVNPLSNNIKAVLNHENSFLYRSSTQTIAEQMAVFAYNSFDKKTGIVLYDDNNTSDSLFASNFIRKYKELNGNLMFYEKIDKQSSFGIAKFLGKDTLANVDFVLFASNEQMIATNLVTALAIANSSTPILTSFNCLGYNSLDYDQFEHYNFHFYYPDFVDYNLDKVKTFRAQYFENHNSLPSDYVFMGYELIHFYNTLTKKYGKNFYQKISEIPLEEGTILDAHLYGKNQDNQMFPIVKFEKSRLIRVN